MLTVGYLEDSGNLKNKRRKSMKKKYMGLVLSMAAASVLTLTGCGGAGGTTVVVVPPEEPVAYNGRLVDSNVAGVSFVCGAVSGTTDANGLFGTCPAGSTATFSVGGMTLGSSVATGDGIFFITDIVGVPRDATDNEDVLKIAVFLQSLDSDGDPTNGIDVPPEAAALFVNNNTITDLTPEEVVVVTTATVVTLQADYPAMTYVPVAEAESNLADSVGDIEDGTIAPPPAPTGSEGGN